MSELSELDKEKQKEKDKLDKARDAKCIPLAKLYLKTILDHDPSLNGKLDEKALTAEYQPMVEEMLKAYLEQDVTIIEYGYIKKLVVELIENLDGLLSGSVNESLRIAEKKLWGVDKEEISFSAIDRVLKS